MIICQCTQLTSADLAHAFERARACSGGQRVSTKAVLQQAGVKLQCAGCLPLLVTEMARHAGAPPNLRWAHTPTYTSVKANRSVQVGEGAA